MDIVTALSDPRFFLPYFKTPATWHNWTIFLRALFGLGIENEQDLEIFKSCTGLESPPKERAKECYAVCSRRSGKSTMAALIACYVAGFTNWQDKLSAGETAQIFILATDLNQAKIVRGYVLGFLNSTPHLRNLIRNTTAEAVELRNRACITIKAASFRGTRGFTTPLVIAEELAFWRDIETGANPAAEILRSVRPSLQASGGFLLGISSPHSRSGFLFERFRDSFSHAGDTLVWKAPSRIMNPLLDVEMIAKAIELDPEAGRSEWLSEWRSDISAFLPAELVESAVIPERILLPKVEGISYFGFVDSSGGRSDSGALGISHREGNRKIVLDVLDERKPPFNPESVTEEFCGILKAYGINLVQGDRYAGSWVSESFQKYGVQYSPAEKTASELYLGLLPLLASGKVELLDQKRLKGQLIGLERKVRAGGKDLVCHSPGMHDDCANAAAGSLVMASSELQRDGVPEFVPNEYPREEQDEMDAEVRDWLLDRKPKKKKPDEFDEKEWDIDSMSQADIEKELGK